MQVVVLLSCVGVPAPVLASMYVALCLLMALKSRELLRAGVPELVISSKQTAPGAESASGGKTSSKRFSACHVGRLPLGEEAKVLFVG